MTASVRPILAILVVLALAAPYRAAAQAPVPGQPPPGVGQPQPPGPPPGVPGQPTVPGAKPEPPKEEEEAPPVPVEPFRQRLTVPEQPIPIPAERVTPPSFVGPDLFNPPAPRGWITFTPTITLSGEFNDNVDFVNRPREWGLSFSAIPGFTLSMQRPSYRLLAGYYTSVEVSARDGTFDFGKPQQLVLDGFYRLSPRTTLSVADQFVYDRASRNVTTRTVSSGEENSWRNTLSAGLDYRLTQLTGLSLTGSHTLLRYSSRVAGLDSNTYRINVGAGHDFTPRVSGGLSLESAYFDVEGEPSAFTETPRLGVNYALTRRLRASVSAGPSFLFRDGNTEVNAAARAGLQYALRAGALQAGYERAVTAENIGVTESQAFFGSADWMVTRRLRASFTPRYSITEENEVANTGRISTLSATLNATYQVARLISLIASYTYIQQRGERRTDDVEQNRLFFGVQYGYPINFE